MCYQFQVHFRLKIHVLTGLNIGDMISKKGERRSTDRMVGVMYCLMEGGSSVVREEMRCWFCCWCWNA